MITPILKKQEVGLSQRTGEDQVQSIRHRGGVCVSVCVYLCVSCNPTSRVWAISSDPSYAS